MFSLGAGFLELRCGFCVIECTVTCGCCVCISGDDSEFDWGDGVCVPADLPLFLFRVQR